jgi:hypothetical protein
MRNINGKEINGRALRVDFADNDKINMPEENSTSSNSSNSNSNSNNKTTETTSVTHIYETIQQLPKSQIYEAVSQFKNLVQNDPERARELLKNNPSLAVSILYMQYLLGMEKEVFYPKKEKKENKEEEEKKKYQEYQQKQIEMMKQQQIQQQIQQQKQYENLLKTVSQQQLQQILSISKEQLESLNESQR